jgi:hypothetical protein
MKDKTEKRVVNLPKEDFDAIKTYCNKKALNMPQWLSKIAIDRISEDDIKTQIQFAIGEASMCWKTVPTGIFDSSEAAKISERLYSIIKEKL